MDYTAITKGVLYFVTLLDRLFVRLIARRSGWTSVVQSRGRGEEISSCLAIFRMIPYTHLLFIHRHSLFTDHRYIFRDHRRRYVAFHCKPTVCSHSLRTNACLSLLSFLMYQAQNMSLYPGPVQGCVKGDLQLVHPKLDGPRQKSESSSPCHKICRCLPYWRHKQDQPISYCPASTVVPHLRDS